MLLPAPSILYRESNSTKSPPLSWSYYLFWVASSNAVQPNSLVSFTSAPASTSIFTVAMSPSARATHSVSAGLDYPAVGPEHSALHDSGRVSYGKVSDAQALDAFELLCETEGILPALESAHALAFAGRLARKMPRSAWILVNLSGRGDKDVVSVAKLEGVTL